jgi:hypothetical protein
MSQRIDEDISYNDHRVWSFNHRSIDYIAKSV